MNEEIYIEEVASFREKVSNQRTAIINRTLKIDSFANFEIIADAVQQLKNSYNNINSKYNQIDLKDEKEYLDYMEELLNILAKNHKVHKNDGNEATTKEWQDVCTLIGYQKYKDQWDKYGVKIIDVMDAESCMIQRKNLDFDYETYMGKNLNNRSINIKALYELSNIDDKIAYCEQILDNIEHAKGKKKKIEVDGTFKRIAVPYVEHYLFCVEILNNLYLERLENNKKINNIEPDVSDNLDDIQVNDIDDYWQIKELMEETERAISVMSFYAGADSDQNVISVTTYDGQNFKINAQDKMQFEEIDLKRQKAMKRLEEIMIQYGCEVNSNEQVSTLLDKILFIEANEKDNSIKETEIKELVAKLALIRNREKFDSLAELTKFFKEEGLSSSDAKKIAKIALNPQIVENDKTISPNEKKKIFHQIIDYISKYVKNPEDNLEENEDIEETKIKEVINLNKDEQPLEKQYQTLERLINGMLKIEDDNKVTLNLNNRTFEVSAKYADIFKLCYYNSIKVMCQLIDKYKNNTDSPIFIDWNTVNNTTKIVDHKKYFDDLACKIANLPIKNPVTINLDGQNYTINKEDQTTFIMCYKLFNLSSNIISKNSQIDSFGKDIHFDMNLCINLPRGDKVGYSQNIIAAILDKEVETPCQEEYNGEMVTIDRKYLNDFMLAKLTIEEYSQKVYLGVLQKVTKALNAIPKKVGNYISKIKKVRKPKNQKELYAKMKKRIPKIALALGFAATLYMGSNSDNLHILDESNKPEIENQDMDFNEQELEDLGNKISSIANQNNDNHEKEPVKEQSDVAEKEDIVDAILENGFTVDDDAHIYDDMYDAYNNMDAKNAYFESDSFRTGTGVAYEYNGEIIFLNTNDPDFEAKKDALKSNGATPVAIRSQNENGLGNGYEGYYRIDDIDVNNAQIGGR